MQDNQVIRALIHLIEEINVQPGEKIPTEAELASMLGVSRPVIREAVSALEAMGLLVARKGSGRVLHSLKIGTAILLLADYIPPSRKWILDLLSVRQIIESGILPSAAQAITEDDIRHLEDLVSTMENKAKSGEYFGFEDRQFHLMLYKRLNNEIVNMILEVFWNLYDKLHSDDVAHSQRLDETAAHHRRILQALKAGDIQRAQHFMNSHFYDTGYALSSKVDAANPPSPLS
jgi:DNA-binding FadR family transcriptional regulator